MKKSSHILNIALLITTYCNAQQPAVSGVVTDSTGSPLPSVTIMIKGSNTSTMTNTSGAFHIRARTAMPITLVFSSAEFKSVERLVLTPDEKINVVMIPEYKTYEAAVVGATLNSTRLVKAPVTVEFVRNKKIQNSPSPNYYDVIGTSKGVDITTSGLLFKTISTRGFNGSGSSRVNQFVDGMDNQAPGLNFFVGNFVGLTQLDVDNVELLPGASSALYGPGGMNGTILIRSKDPFKYEGLSMEAKQGVMHIGSSARDGASPYGDYSLRFAKVINNKLAFKIGAQYTRAKDWLASDSANYKRSGNTGRIIAGNRRTDPGYDGVNVYGDETNADIRPIMYGVAGSYPDGSAEQQAILQLANSMSEPVTVTRTGYNEKDMIDPVTKNIKLSGALHYKITSNLEAQLIGYWATGNTVYTGNNRYVFKDIKLGQYKFELRHRDWFFRTYTTQEDAGQAYSATIAAQVLNEAWKPSYDPTNPAGSWYVQYAGAYIDARLHGQEDLTAHNLARGYADNGRPAAGSAAFNNLLSQVNKTPIPHGGLFLEKSQLWMNEAQYNFSKQIKFVELIVGANLKKYILDSKGTLFIDTAKPIRINETGVYAQITKHLLNDYLTLSASGRYDKNEDFKGHFTPRFTALVKLIKNNYLRLSYQTAYRFPSTQQKYIRLNVGDYSILGGLPWVMDYMGSKDGNIQELVNGVPAGPYVYKEFKPESSRSFEIGYKSVIADKLLIDAYGYWGQYRDFLGRNALINLSTGAVFSTVVNSATKVKTHGFGLGLDYTTRNNFNIFLNGYSDVITDVPAGFQAFFNTPKYRLNAGVGNSGFGQSKRAGFNVVFHWQDAFTWDGELANGPVNAFTSLDAQVNYKFPKIRSMVKMGATNLLNHYYKNGYANPEIGGLYYVSIAYNVL